MTKGPKGKDLTIFVRFGGLDLKTQHGHTEQQKTYHAPPASRGFYAFPKVAQSLFLVGSMDKFQPSTVPKSKEGDDYDIHNKKRRFALSAMRKEFKKDSGNIWSHLEEYVKNNEIIDRHGSWIKTTIKDWQKAFRKMSLKSRMPSIKEFGFSNNNINQSPGIIGYFSLDDCEVFIDEKV